LDDAKLAEENFHRLGNVLVPTDSYGPLIEKKMQELILLLLLGKFHMVRV